MDVRRSLLLALLPVLLSWGCVRFSAHPLTMEWPASSLVHQQETGGLSVAARSIAGGDGELRVVGRRTRGNGYFPVELLFENHGGRPWIILCRGIHLVTEQGDTYDVASYGEVYRASRYPRNSALWGIPLGFLPAFLISEHIDDENEAFLADLRQKAIRDIRLWRNPAHYHCVAFFRMPTEKARKLRHGDYVVTVEVERQQARSDEESVVRFRLAPEDPLE